MGRLSTHLKYHMICFKEPMYIIFSILNLFYLVIRANILAQGGVTSLGVPQLDLQEACKLNCQFIVFGCIVVALVSNRKTNADTELLKCCR
jgi:hypothetical protein